MPNQLGIDHFDLEDALGGQKEYMCSADLKEFIETYHLDLSMDGNFNPAPMLSEATMIPITFTIHRVPGSWSAI